MMTAIIIGYAVNIVISLGANYYTYRKGFDLTVKELFWCVMFSLIPYFNLILLPHWIDCNDFVVIKGRKK